MRKSAWLTIVITLIMLSFAACRLGLSDNESENRQNNKETESIQSGEEESSEGVPKSQIAADLQGIEDVKNGVIPSNRWNPEKEYAFQDYSITKRQTNIDDKQDIVYCTVNISNGYVKSSLEYKLEYNLYDVGGWILDYATLLNKESVPLTGADKTSIEDFTVNIGDYIPYKSPYGSYGDNSPGYNDILFSDGNIGSDHGEKIKVSINDDCVMETGKGTDLENGIDKTYYTYSVNHCKIHASLELNFDQDDGWVLSSGKGTSYMKILEIEVDWESACNGMFKVKSDYGVELWLQEYNSLGTATVVVYNFGVDIYARNETAYVDTSEYSMTFMYTKYVSGMQNPYERQERVFYYDFLKDVWHSKGIRSPFERAW